MILPSVVFLGLASIHFTLDVVNDKKRVIVLFNLPVFLLLSLSPFPHPAKPHTDDTWEPIWADRHIIPYYQTAGKARTPPDPLDTEEQIMLLECRLGQVDGSIRVKKALWRHPCPLRCTVSFKSVCWQNSDNNFGSCAMFWLAVRIIFIERTSLLMKLCLLSGAVLLLFVFGLPVCSKNSVSLHSKNDIFVSEENNIYFLMTGIKIWKYHKTFPNSTWEMTNFTHILDLILPLSFIFFKPMLVKID